MSSNIKAKINDVLDQHSSHCQYHVDVSHDGVDEDWYPKSFLYDLYVWDGDTITTYHYENWFTPGDEDAPFEKIESRNAMQFFKSNICGVRRSDFMTRA